MTGGFAGVDVFFVLSGFLITGILLREYASRGKIDFANFWSRRVRRILPQATLVLLITALLSIRFVSPLLMESVGRDIKFSGFFALNWRAAGRAVDYSDPGNDLTPVLHYWSLAVEEQFYVVWPALIAIFLYLGRRNLSARFMPTMLLTITLLVLSLLYCALQTSGNQPLAFFSTFSRIWQLLSGALLAILLHRGVACSGTMSRWVGPAGLTLVICGFIFVDASQGTPFPVALIPVIGTAGVIFAGTATGVTNMASRLLSWQPLTYVGRISYAWYLWHWPALYFGKALLPGAGLAGVITAIIVSFVLSVLTYHFFETPIRFHRSLVKSSRNSLVMGFGMVAISVLSGFALVSYSKDQTVLLTNGGRLLVRDIVDDRSTAYKLDCHLSQLEVEHGECKFGPMGKNADVVLFGDSHAAQFFDVLKVASASRDATMLMRSKSACPAILGSVWNRKFNRIYRECDIWKNQVIETIAQEKPKLVILSNATAYQMFDQVAGTAVDSSEGVEIYRNSLKAMIRKLLSSAGKVVLIMDTPRLPEEPVNCLARNPSNEDACQWALASNSTGNDFVPDLGEFGDRVVLLSLNDGICPGKVCRAIIDGHPVFYDVSHLTVSFTGRFEMIFDGLLNNAGL